MAGAGAGRAWPPSLTAGSRDHRRGLATPIAHIRKAEPKRDNASCGVLVIAPLITPLLVGGMRRAPVALDAHFVLLIEVVKVPTASALPDLRLPASSRQPVRAFD